MAAAQRAEGGGGPLELGTLTVSSAEWAAALCSEPSNPLPPGVYEFDFEGNEEDGSLSERYVALLRASRTRVDGYRGVRSSGVASDGVDATSSRAPPARFAHWLHECILESKMAAYPLYLLIYLQTRSVTQDCINPSLLHGCPASLACSAMAADQLLMVEWFYRCVRGTLGTRHRPLLSDDFLAGRCAAVRSALSGVGDLEYGRHLAARLACALRAHYGAGTDTGAVCESLPDAALVALFSRLHGLPCSAVAGPDLAVSCREARTRRPGGALAILPRLRRSLPGASAQGLRGLVEALAGA